VVLSHQTGVRIPVALPTSRRGGVGIAAAALAAVCLLVPGHAAGQPRETTHAAPRSGLSTPPNVERLDSQAGITEYRLRSNGMKILLAPNHAAPVVTFFVVYHIGSRNEAPGNTGSAHLLEHMLFNKSTKNYGRANGHPTIQETLFEAGADFSTSNMTTWLDRMTGYSTVPSDKLELAMKIEADRMSRALILDSERQPEMSVVRNEYEIGENNPYRALGKAVIAAAIVAHPYHWPTIGYRSDIEGVSTETLRQHYRTYFWPNNAEAIVVGDFDPIQALRMFNQNFGSLPRSTRPIPQVITVEPPQEGERRVTVSRPGQVSIVEIAWMRPGALDPDFIALDVLSTILGSGVNSRLYQALVETGLASDVDASNYTLMDPYPLVVEATVAPGSTPEKVEAALKEAAYKVGESGVTQVELDRAKNQLEVAVIRQRDGTYQLASSLGEAVASANWKWFVTYVDSMRAVTAEDVQRVAAKYLVPQHATVGWFVPQTDAPPQKASAPKGVTRSKWPGAGGAARDGETTRAPFAARTLHRVLGNGLTLNVVESHAVPTVAVNGVVLAGRMDQPADMPALSELTAMMLSRGAAGRDKRALAAALDGVGARLDISSDLNDATITGSALSRDTRLLLSILADELARATFPDSELTKAKSEMKSDVLRAYDNTTARAFDRLSQLVYPVGHPYRAPDKDAMLANLDRLRRSDLETFYRKRYVGASVILSVVGDVDTAAVAALVDSLFGGMTRGERPRFDIPVTAPDPPQRVAVTMHGKANMDLIYGEASGLRRTDGDWNAAIIANAALGQSGLSSRLGTQVRDKEGLSYTVVSRFIWSDYLDGVWMAYVAVAPQNLARASKSAYDVIQKYVAEGITDKELQTQKNYFANNYRVRLASNAGVAAALTVADKFGFGPRYLDEFPDQIRTVTREQVNAAVRAKIVPDKLNLVVAGDLESLPQ
jgi:zinc protease